MQGFSLKYMMDIMFIDHENMGFKGQLKTFPSDFKVVELSENGLPCHNVMIDDMAESRQYSKSFAQKDEKKYLDVASSEHNARVKESSDELACKRVKLEKDPASNNDPSENKLSCDLEFCKSAMTSLVSSDVLEQLNTSELHTVESLKVEVGSFCDKEDRRKIHHCIRMLFPHFCTSTEKPYKIIVQLCPKYSYFEKLLGKEEASSFLQFACVKCLETGQDSYDITVNLQKDDRRLVHRGIDNYFGKLLMSKTKSDGNIIQVKRKPLQRKVKNTTNFCSFVLYKHNTETLDAIQQLSQHFCVKPYQFSYAGTKDKLAETWQRMRVKGMNKMDLLKFSKTLPRHLRVSDVEMTSSPLRLGALSGNRFNIRLRKIGTSKSKVSQMQVDDCAQQIGSTAVPLKENVENSLRFAENNGFVNYFGSQRFGRMVNINTIANEKHESRDNINQSEQFEASSIGLAILRHDMKAAVISLLSPSLSQSDDVTETAKQYFVETGDIAGAIKRMPSYQVRELSILRTLRKFAANIKDLDKKPDSPSETVHSSNHSDTINCENYATSAYTKALLSLPHNALLLYAHAHCSLVWNRAVTERLQKLGGDVVEGDLVMTGPTDQVHALTADDVKRKLFSIRDVVLPLPGNQIIFPPNLKSFYDEILKHDGLLSKSQDVGGTFRVNQLRINLSGTYRKIVEVPRNFHYKWISCDDIVQSEEAYTCRTTNESCFDQEAGHNVGSNPGCTDLILSLTFDLPSSCYATTFLQQVTKNEIYQC